MLTYPKATPEARDAYAKAAYNNAYLYWSQVDPEIDAHSVTLLMSSADGAGRWFWLLDELAGWYSFGFDQGVASVLDGDPSRVGDWQRPLIEASMRDAPAPTVIVSWTSVPTPPDFLARNVGYRDGANAAAGALAQSYRDGGMLASSGRINEYNLAKPGAVATPAPVEVPAPVFAPAPAPVFAATPAETSSGFVPYVVVGAGAAGALFWWFGMRRRR